MSCFHIPTGTRLKTERSVSLRIESSRVGSDAAAIRQLQSSSNRVVICLMTSRVSIFLCLRRVAIVFGGTVAAAPSGFRPGPAGSEGEGCCRSGLKHWYLVWLELMALPLYGFGKSRFHLSLFASCCYRVRWHCGGGAERFPAGSGSFRS
jgi:hypothetical protein